MSARSPQTKDITLERRILRRIFPERKPYFAVSSDFLKIVRYLVKPICELKELTLGDLRWNIVLYRSSFHNFASCEAFLYYNRFLKG